MRPLTAIIYAKELERRRMIFVARQVRYAFYTYLPKEPGWVRIYLFDQNECLLQSGMLANSIHKGNHPEGDRALAFFRAGSVSQ